jgi:phosphoribosylformimino-5-aminoimidazole carboxamide ribotide isomerase
VIIFPAIDLRKGRCVRLIRGDVRDETVYSENPVDVAKHWQSRGAQWLHVVDLDGALEGTPRNQEHIFAIVKAVKIPVQVGGGIRDFETAKKLLDKGVRRVILGTSAAQDEKFLKRALEKFGDKVVVGIDAKDGYVAVKGWVEKSKLKAVVFAKKMQDLGVKTIIYTDIAKDGMLQGPNLEAVTQMAKALKIPVIASGGVSTLKDIERLRKLESKGVIGAIVGKALYAGNLDLKDVIASAKGPGQRPKARPGKKASRKAASTRKAAAPKRKAKR